MRFHGYKEGGLYEVVGRPPRRPLRAVQASIEGTSVFTYIPNNNIIMFLERLDSGHALILYRDKTWRLSRQLSRYLRPLPPENSEK